MSVAAKRVTVPRYSPREVLEAYEEWTNTPTDQLLRRERAWFRYVDRRDGLVEGTTEAKRLQLVVPVEPEQDEFENDDRDDLETEESA